MQIPWQRKWQSHTVGGHVGQGRVCLTSEGWQDRFLSQNPFIQVSLFPKLIFASLKCLDMEPVWILWTISQFQKHSEDSYKAHSVKYKTRCFALSQASWSCFFTPVKRRQEILRNILLHHHVLQNQALGLMKICLALYHGKNTMTFPLPLTYLNNNT